MQAYESFTELHNVEIKGNNKLALSKVELLYEKSIMLLHLRKEKYMSETICYIKMDRYVESTSEDVFFKDAGSVLCEDNMVSTKIRSIKIYKFTKGKNQEYKKRDDKRCVISILKIIELIQQTCPGVTVENLGETEVVLELIQVDKHKGWKQGLKIVMVAVISFFGTAFTIMAYHNDIGISNVFQQIHRIIIGSEPEGLSALELAYSAGLSLGIIVFFNHIGRRRITKDPTPIEVEMRKYEKDVNDALVDTAEREGETLDVS